jgi:YD repeat-containing protein
MEQSQMKQAGIRMKTRIATIALATALAFIGAHGAIFQIPAGGPSNSGSSTYPVAPGSSALFAGTNEYIPSGAGGTVLQNVNLTTGQPVYTVPIAEIGMGKARFPIALSYSGPVRQMFDADNENGAPGWIGYGWRFSTPFVGANTKGTVNPLDDVFYCNLGQYGGGQLLQAGDGKFYLSNNPAIRIQQTPATEGTASRWEFIHPDGVRMVFGSMKAGDNAERYMARSAGAIQASPYTASGYGSIIYRWDLSIMDSRPLSGALLDRLEFRYGRTDVPVTSGRTYTRESYVREIAAVNAAGVDVEKYSFVTADKGSNEYPSTSAEKAIAQTIFETKWLQKIEWFLESSPTVERRINFIPTLKVPALYTKRFLDSIHFEYQTALGTMVTDPGANWKFTYDANANRHYGLKTMTRATVTEEFVYGRPDYNGYPNWTTRTKQEGQVRKLKKSDNTELGISTGTDLKNRFENETSCTEKFCFIAVIERNTNDVLTLEVFKNNGNYFTNANLGTQPFRKTFTSTFANSLQIIPWNDNVIVVDTKAKVLKLYEWTGETFVEHVDILRRIINGVSTPVAKFGSSQYPYKVTVGGDYFLVQDDNFIDNCSGGNALGAAKVYVVRKVGGVWKDLNEGECQGVANCAINTTEDFGEPYNRSTSRCMEYTTQNLMVSASPSMFHIVHGGTNIILTFAQSPDGVSFTSIGSKYLSFNTNVHTLTKFNNWQNVITAPIQFGRDYFIVTSKTFGGSTSRVDAMHYDGVNIRRVGGVENYPEGTDNKTMAWAGEDYFLTLNSPGNTTMATLNLLKKRVVSTSGVPTSMTFDAFTVTGNVDRTKLLKVRAYPKAFTLEIHATPTSTPPSGAPLVSATTGNYLTDIWEVDPALSGNPFRKISDSFKDGNGKNYFDITFTPSNNLVSAKSCLSTANIACAGNAGDALKFVTAVVTPGQGPAGGAFLRDVKDVYHPMPAGASYHLNQFVMSAASRIGAICMLNQQSQKVDFELLQSMGTGFTQFPYQWGATGFSGDINFVSAFKRTSGLTGNNRGHWTEYGMFYIPDSKGIIDKTPEYNTHLQSFSFPTTGVITYQGSEAQTTPRCIKMETVSHIIDDLDVPLPESHLNKAGLMTKSRVHDVDAQKNMESIRDEVSRTEVEYYDPAGETFWPANLKMVRQKKITSINWASNRSHQTQSVSFHKYNPYNNQPLFTKSNKAGQWYLSQSLYQTTGENKSLPTASYNFRFAAEPPDATLNGWSNSALVYNQDNAIQKTLAASKQEYDPVFPYEIQKTKVWRDVDLTLDDDELKRGVDPIYLNSNGWEERDVVEKRNAVGLPTQTRKVLSEGTGLSRYTSYFYEGPRPFLVGVVDNAPLEDVGVMTAEFGPGLFLDANGPWAFQGSGNGVSYKAHSGRRGLKLVTNPGLSIDIKLKGGAPLQYDYIVSAWIYIESGSPLITVQRFKNGGTAYDIFQTATPVGQVIAAKKWQRYQVRVTAAQLAGSQNLFATVNSGDFLRISFGATAAAGIHVDDIVCRPSNTTMGLSVYNAKGQITESINNDNLVTTYEYDAFGKLSATKDDLNRSYMSQTTHLPGEND